MTITVLNYCCDLIFTSELFKGKHILFILKSLGQRFPLLSILIES